MLNKIDGIHLYSTVSSYICEQLFISLKVAHYSIQVMTHHLKYIILFVFTLSACHTSAQSLRKLMERPLGIVESKWETNAQGGRELNYYNEDYCDYYLYRINDRSYNLIPGKNTVFRIEKNSQAENPFKSSSSYRYYRGKFPKNFQIGTLYALPVKDGQKTGWQTDPREPVKTLNFRIKESDTIYATRSGIACTTANTQQLLIYHPDQTFAAYLVMSENFIQPGEEVQVGQPIGKAGPSRVSISFFFLDENKFKGGESSGYPYSHFIPVFRTTVGDTKLKEKTIYQAVVDDELIMQDMSKRDKKKYMKQKNLK